jgi:ribosome biogenesis protein Nip4
MLEESKILKIGKNYYLAGPKLIELRSKINRDLFAAGLYLGCDSGKHFDPSPALIDMLSKMDKSGSRKIYIASKVEGLFLYGRNILKDSITKNPNNIDSGYVFVQNESDENLGYGIFQKQCEQVIIKNLLDKGFYLRKEVKRKRND